MKEWIGTWTITWSDSVQPEVSSTTVVPGTVSSKSSRVSHWGSQHMMSYCMSHSPNPVPWCAVKRLILCDHSRCIFLLDDSVCALCSGWVLWPVCSVLCESLAASPLTGMAEHRRVEKPLQPAYIYIFWFSWKIKHIIWDISMETGSNSVLSKLLISILIRLARTSYSSK